METLGARGLFLPDFVIFFLDFFCEVEAEYNCVVDVGVPQGLLQAYSLVSSPAAMWNPRPGPPRYAVCRAWEPYRLNDDTVLLEIK